MPAAELRAEDVELLTTVGAHEIQAAVRSERGTEDRIDAVDEVGQADRCARNAIDDVHAPQGTAFA